MLVAMSLRMRMSIGALLPLFAALATQAGYTLLSERSAMETGLEEKAQSLAGLMVNVVGPSLAFNDDKSVTDALGYVASGSDFGFSAVTGTDGKTVGFRGDSTLHSRVDAMLVGVTQAGVVKLDNVIVAAAPVISDGKQIGTVFVGLHSDEVDAQATHMSEWAAGISIVGIMIAVIVVLVLAGKIAHRNQRMRLVLDNVDEGLVTINRDGTVDPECSAAFERWFGVPGAGQFSASIAGSDDRLRAMLALAWSEIVEGVMPIELLVDQFPRNMARDGKHFRLDIKPLFERRVLVGALLRIRDVTAEVETQRTLAMQREYVAVFERALADPHGVREFMEDTSKLVNSVQVDKAGDVERKRAAHTIKGNAAIYGIDSVAQAAHRFEDRLAMDHEMDANSVQELVAVWGAFVGRVEHLLGTGNHVDVSRNEIEELAELAQGGGAIVADRLRGLLLEPVTIRFDGFRRQIELLATKLDKPTPTVVIAADGVLTLPDRLRPFWSTFGHLVRNALDHGIESADERRAAGKPEAGTIELRASRTGNETVLEIVDDGRGVNWERVRSKAVAASMPADTQEDLERALFSDGLSTADMVSETSGRGIGLAAVRAAVLEVGGRLAVVSRQGGGTRFTFTFPSGSVRHRRWTLPMPTIASFDGRQELS